MHIDVPDQWTFRHGELYKKAICSFIYSTRYTLSVYYVPSLLMPGAGTTATKKTRSTELNDYMGNPFPIFKMVSLWSWVPYHLPPLPLLPIPSLYCTFVKIRKMCSLSADIALGQKAWEVMQGLNFSSPHHLAKYLWSVPKLHNDLLQWPSGTWHSWGNLAWSFTWSQQNLHF